MTEDAPTLEPTLVPAEEKVEEQAEVANRRIEASARLQEEQTIEAPQASESRTFVSAEEYNNTRFLAREGKVVKAPIVAGSTSGIVPLITRTDDLFAEFTAGVLVTKVPEVIAWCKAHPQVCRDATDPRTPGWATLKAMQAPKANREAALGKEIDVDAMAFPELSGVDGAVAAVPSGGDVGTQAVAAALNTKEKLEQVESERAEDTERLKP